jgi:hypothetical protein
MPGCVQYTRHAVAIPDLRDELGDAGRVRVAARLEPGCRRPRSKVVDARRIRELLELQVEQLAGFTPRREVRGAARGDGDRRESRESQTKKRAPDRVHEKSVSKV